MAFFLKKNTVVHAEHVTRRF